MTAGIAATMLVTLLGRMRLVARGALPDHDLALYQVAMLAGGAGRVSDTVLSFLTWSGMLEARDISDRLVRVVGVNSVSDLHPVELAVLGAVDPAGVRPEAAMGAGRLAALHHVGGLEGLVVDPGARRAVDAMVIFGCGAVAGSGVWWLAAREGPMAGFVPLLALVALLYAGWWFFFGRPYRTRNGEKILEDLRVRFDDDLQIAAVGVTSLPLERAMHIIALYGRDALTGGLSGLRKVMTGNPSPIPLRSSLGT
ncbi:MAG: TIGR04222 domain-containing membrane protein [Actinomycetota bacterium]